MKRFYWGGTAIAIAGSVLTLSLLTWGSSEFDSLSKTILWVASILLGILSVCLCYEAAIRTFCRRIEETVTVATCTTKRHLSRQGASWTTEIFTTEYPGERLWTNGCHKFAVGDKVKIARYVRANGLTMRYDLEV